MKRTFTIVGILVAVLMLGIGYAAITGTTLSITGTAAAGVDNSNFVVRFDQETPVTKNSFVSAAAITGDTAATISVEGLTTVNQTATATYTILNASTDLVANLVAEVTQNTNSDYFDVTTSFASNSVAAGESTTITVSVRLKKTPVESQTGNITVQITPTAAVRAN